MIRYTFVSSPIGDLLVAGNDDGAVVEIHFRGATPRDEWERDDSGFDDVRAQLREYFAGTLRAFTLPLAPTGTPFQLDVWNALRKIPYGDTRSYGQLAQQLGRPNASRAVGAANGANPIPIVIPCHRVIGGDGRLTGYGGGLPLKRALLELEGALPRSATLFD